MKKKRSVGIILIIILTVSIGIFAGCGNENNKGNDNDSVLPCGVNFGDSGETVRSKAAEVSSTNDVDDVDRGIYAYSVEHLGYSGNVLFQMDNDVLDAVIFYAYQKADETYVGLVNELTSKYGEPISGFNSFGNPTSEWDLDTMTIVATNGIDRSVRYSEP